MVLTLSNEAPLWGFLFLTVCLLFISVVIQFLSKKNGHAEAQNPDECLSPDCVRCSKPDSILKRAQKKLNTVPKSSEAKALSKDIEDSLSHNKLQKGNLSFRISSPKVLFIRGLCERSIFLPTEFPELQILVKNYAQIKLEFNHLYQSPLEETKSLWKINSTESGKWEIVHLINQGSHTRASELCPITMSLLKKLSSIIMHDNVFGNVAFSVIHPQTSIETHCGSTNCRIRCHLGLKVPSNCCLTVDGVTHQWREAELLCFNDAFPHSVSHKGHSESDVRVVLMVDIWHPEVSDCLRELIDTVFKNFH